MATEGGDVSSGLRFCSACSDDWPALLASARRGSNAALGEICERLRHHLVAMVARHLGDGLQSKVGDSDIVQQTMLDVCRDFRSFRGNTVLEYQAWVTRALQRNILDVARSFRETQRRQAAREMPYDREAAGLISTVDHRTASSIFLRREADEELLRAVARLPPRQQQVIELRHRRGLAYVQIAELLGITEVAARKIWSRALSTLGRELNAEHD